MSIAIVNAISGQSILVSKQTLDDYDLVRQTCMDSGIGEVVDFSPMDAASAGFRWDDGNDNIMVVSYYQ